MPLRSRPAFALPGPRKVVVRGVPIELCQFIKFGGLTESGGEAKQLISEGLVLLNGCVETQKRKKLLDLYYADKITATMFNEEETALTRHTRRYPRKVAAHDYEGAERHESD